MWTLEWCPEKDRSLRDEHGVQGLLASGTGAAVRHHAPKVIRSSGPGDGCWYQPISRRQGVHSAPDKRPLSDYISVWLAISDYF